jgi:hypothetical protein
MKKFYHESYLRYAHEPTRKRKEVIFLFIFLMLFLFSCVDDDSAETEKIKVVNMTNEDVKIYYLFFDVEMMKTIIRRDEERFIFFSSGTTYYSRGEKTKKDYGERIFNKVPSNVDVQRVWMIM